MFYFGVPLRPKEASRDWNQVCDRFRATVRSIMRQTSPDFILLVACHQIPDMNGASDSRIEFIQAPFDPPDLEDYPGQMVDKGRKVHLILSTIKRRGVGHYMPVDADDLVNKRIVEFVQERPQVPGWTIRLGYEHKLGTDFVQLNPAMNRHCGTTHIVALHDEDLPQDMSDVDAPDALAKYVLRRPFHTWPRAFAGSGRKFRTLPFVGCVYVTGYSDNHSLNRPYSIRRRQLSLRQLILSASPKVRLKERTRDEFGL